MKIETVEFDRYSHYDPLKHWYIIYFNNYDAIHNCIELDNKHKLNFTIDIWRKHENK